jgi:copper transport protein
LALAEGAAGPAAALAHADFERANPAPGATLQSSPAQISMEFTEPLSHQLTTAALFNARSGRRVAAEVAFPTANELLLHPTRQLPVAAYLVRWHTVSILDGHALEGSFGFGVGVTPSGRLLNETSLARAGWASVGLSGLWYAALLFFGGGLLGALVLRSRPRPASWLLAGEGRAALVPSGRPDTASRRIWRRTRAAGWLAVAAGVGMTLAETQNAAGSLSWHAIDAYLFSTISGGVRAAAVALVALAALLAGRARRIASIALVATLASLAVAGHADSASPRVLALLSNWLHLVAGTIWVGGIAQIVATWGVALRRLSLPERRRVITEVLRRFGRVALPAAVIVVAAGLVNALIDLGRVSALWRTGYGRVLMIKLALVGLLLLASYLHAFVFRPQSTQPGDGHVAADRRHWRLLLSQPPLAAVVVGAAALLAAFALPARGLLQRAATRTRNAPVTAVRRPSANQLAVAEEAGPWIAAAWVNPASTFATGTVRLLSYKIRSVPAKLTIPDARTSSCGPGCLTFKVPPARRSLRVLARLRGTASVALIPIAWRTRRTAHAKRILSEAAAAVSRLHFWQIAERLHTGLGGPSPVSHYWIGGRYRYRVAYHSAIFGETIGIGSHTWVHRPDRTWQKSAGPPLDTRKLMPWWTHRVGVRLLDLTQSQGRPVADLALADIHPPSAGLSFWFRLRIDLNSKLPISMRMITAAHFMDQRYFALNAPVVVVPPH